MRKLIFTLFFLSMTIRAAELPIVVDPVINATPPGSKVTAGYMTLVNETDKDITLTGAFSPSIAKIEIHLSSVKNDVASMEKQDSVTIKAGDTLEFKHGSYHLMLMELTEPLTEDQTIDVIINSSGGDFLIEMPVKKIGSTKHTHSDTKHGDEKIDDMKHADMNKTEGELTEASTQSDKMKDGDAHEEKTKTVH